MTVSQGRGLDGNLGDIPGEEVVRWAVYKRKFRSLSRKHHLKVCLSSACREEDCKRNLMGLTQGRSRLFVTAKLGFSFEPRGRPCTSSLLFQGGKSNAAKL